MKIAKKLQKRSHTKVVLLPYFAVLVGEEVLLFHLRLSPEEAVVEVTIQMTRLANCLLLHGPRFRLEVIRDDVEETVYCMVLDDQT